MPSVSLPIIDSPPLPTPVGLIVLAVLVGILIVKVLLQSAFRLPHERLQRALNIITWPLLVVFVIVVLERFRDLS